MPAYKNIAIAGVGHLGEFFLTEFSKKDVSVKVISRKDSSKKVSLPSNAQLVPVDYDSPDDLQKALQNVDVLISTLSVFGVRGPQEALARAAKAAGVQLFIPSEFGSPHVNVKIFSGKKHLNDVLEEIGIPFTLVFNGVWPDFGVGPILGFKFPTEVNVPGDGRDPISWTSRPSVASFLAEALTSPSIPKLPRVLRLEGNRASYRDIVALYEKAKGVKVKVNEIPVEELAQRLAKNPDDALAAILKEYTEGKGAVGEPNGKEIWPGWAPEALEDIVSRL